MKGQTTQNQSLNDLKKVFAKQLRSVGVKQGDSKPGDGRYSALLRKSYSK